MTKRRASSHKTTTSQSKTLFEKQLLKWARDESLKFLDELTTARLRKFRASCNNGALTTQSKHHRLNGFFALIHLGQRHLRQLESLSPGKAASDGCTPCAYASKPSSQRGAFPPHRPTPPRFAVIPDASKSPPPSHASNT